MQVEPRKGASGLAHSHGGGRPRPPTCARSERNFVVHFAAAAAPAGAGCRRDLARGAGRAELATGVVAAEFAAATSATSAIEQSELAAESLQHHFGRIAILARLILPLARLQLALDEDLGALLEILLGDPAQILVEDDDAVPLGLFLALAGRFVAPRIGGGDAQIGDRPTVLGATNFWIGAQVADQDHFIDAACHDSLRSFP